MKFSCEHKIYEKYTFLPSYSDTDAIALVGSMGSLEVNLNKCSGSWLLRFAFQKIGEGVEQLCSANL